MNTFATREKNAEAKTEDRSAKMTELPEYIDGLPNLCGAEDQLDGAIREGRQHPVFVPQGSVGFGEIESPFAIALHMPQPLIPAGGSDLHTAATIRSEEHTSEL